MNITFYKFFVGRQPGISASKLQKVPLDCLFSGKYLESHEIAAQQQQAKERQAIYAALPDVVKLAIPPTQAGQKVGQDYLNRLQNHPLLQQNTDLHKAILGPSGVLKTHQRPTAFQNEETILTTLSEIQRLSKDPIVASVGDPLLLYLQDPLLKHELICQPYRFLQKVPAWVYQPSGIWNHHMALANFSTLADESVKLLIIQSTVRSIAHQVQQKLNSKNRLAVPLETKEVKQLLQVAQAVRQLKQDADKIKALQFFERLKPYKIPALSDAKITAFSAVGTLSDRKLALKQIQTLFEDPDPDKRQAGLLALSFIPDDAFKLTWLKKLRHQSTVETELLKYLPQVIASLQNPQEREQQCQQFEQAETKELSGILTNKADLKKALVDELHTAIGERTRILIEGEKYLKNKPLRLPSGKTVSRLNKKDLTPDLMGKLIQNPALALQAFSLASAQTVREDILQQTLSLGNPSVVRVMAPFLKDIKEIRTQLGLLEKILPKLEPERAGPFVYQFFKDMPKKRINDWWVQLAMVSENPLVLKILPFAIAALVNNQPWDPQRPTWNPWDYFDQFLAQHPDERTSLIQALALCEENTTDKFLILSQMLFVTLSPEDRQQVYQLWHPFRDRQKFCMIKDLIEENDELSDEERYLIARACSTIQEDPVRDELIQDLKKEYPKDRAILTGLQMGNIAARLSREGSLFQQVPYLPLLESAVDTYWPGTLSFLQAARLAGLLKKMGKLPEELTAPRGLPLQFEQLRQYLIDQKLKILTSTTATQLTDTQYERDITRFLQAYSEPILEALILTGEAPLKIKLELGISPFRNYVSMVQTLLSHEELVKPLFQCCQQLAQTQNKDKDQIKFLEIAYGMLYLKQKPALLDALHTMIEQHQVSVPNISRTFFKTMARVCGLSPKTVENLTEEDFTAWSQKYLNTLAVAFAKFPENSEEQLKAVCHLALTKDFAGFIQGDISMPELVEHSAANLLTRLQFRTANLDYERWLNYQNPVVVPFQLPSTAQQTLNIRDRIAGDIQALLQEAVTNEVVQNYLKVCPLPGAEADRMKAFVKGLNATLSQHGCWKKAKQKKNDALLALLDNLRTHLKDIEQIGNFPPGLTAFTLNVWKREPQHDLFHGSYSPCCLALNADKGRSMVETLLHTMFQLVEIKTNTGITIGFSILYWAMNPQTQQPMLIANNIDVASPYQHIREIRDGLAQLMEDYGRAVAGKEVETFLGKYANKLPVKDLLEVKEVPLRVIGATATDTFYLDSLRRYQWANIRKTHQVNLYRLRAPLEAGAAITRRLTPTQKTTQRQEIS